jgi:PAS domain S-box-containing protein
MTFPLAAHGSRVDAERSSDTSSDTTLRGGPRGTVLLVDDSLLIRDLIGAALRVAGYTVKDVEDGETALGLLEKVPFDVVITDLRLADIDGFGVLETVRRLRMDCELIVLTGTHANDIDAAVRALRLGAHDFLMKPMTGADQAVLSVDRAVEKKRQRLALREAEARYHQLFDRLPIGLYRTSPDGRFLDANPTLVQMLGCPDRATLLSLSAATFYARPEDRDRWRGDVERQGVVHHFETPLRRLDGTVLWVDDTVSAVRDAQGRLLCYEGSLEDITERKRAEEALHLQTGQLERIAHAMTTFLTGEDLAGSCAPLLSAALVQTGSENGFIGVVEGKDLRIVAEHAFDWDALLPGDALTKARQAQQRSGQLVFAGFEESLAGMLGAQPCSNEAPCSGSPGILAVRICRGPEPVGVIAVGGRERAGGPAERARLELLTHATGVIFGSHCQARGQAALEAQLRQAQKMEAVGRLAGGVAHDFNNLLTVITGYSDLLLRELPKDHPRRRPVSEILKAADRATDLVRQLLAFSRQQVVHPRILDLNNIVCDVESLLGRLIGEDIELARDLDPELARVRVDRGQIEQILMNLAVNARDAMPGGGRLSVATANVDLDEAFVAAHMGASQGPHAMLAVSDTGHGMDKETLSHIFEPFFTTKEVGKGTGLGLATVYGIVKQAGGYIAVESEVGQGTTFRIYLPVTDAIAPKTPSAERTASVPRGSGTVLLVEDEDMVRDLAGQALVLQGYDVLVASDGAQALRIAAEHDGAISLLLTDVVMPGMSGRQLAEAITALSPATGVLYMSGYSDREACRAVAEPPEAFIQKPFTVERLAARVRERLQAKVGS